MAKAGKVAEAGRLAELERLKAAKPPELPKPEGTNGVKIKAKRPSWRQSEKDVGEKLGDGYEEQKSFKNGKEVPYGTEGSTRPDWYKPGSSIEVKNYNIETQAGQDQLIQNVSDQAISRATQLPPNTVQSVFLDVRGQQASTETLDRVIQSITTRSNGIIQPSNINILR
jgi:hypothetical protein